jgi:hypothetical protein
MAAQGSAEESRPKRSEQYQVGLGRAAMNGKKRKGIVANKGQSSLVRAGQVGTKEWAKKGRMLELALACGGQGGLGRTGLSRLEQDKWAGLEKAGQGMVLGRQDKHDRCENEQRRVAGKEQDRPGHRTTTV